MKPMFLFIMVGLSIGFANYSQATTAPSTVSTDPNAHQVNIRLMTQWNLTKQGLQSGKLTGNQFGSLRVSLTTVHQQEISFFKQNGNHSLTADQQTQLNQMLNNNSAILGETPLN